MSQDQEENILQSAEKEKKFVSKGRSTPKLSRLVSSLEKTSQEESSIINDLYRKSLKKLGSELLAITEAELNKTRSVMEEQNRALNKAKRFGLWKVALLNVAILASVLIGTWGWAEIMTEKAISAQAELQQTMRKVAAEEDRLRNILTINFEGRDYIQIVEGQKPLEFVGRNGYWYLIKK